jgi:RNA 2',3'-cyclic 3'-phosphodiesterase
MRLFVAVDLDDQVREEVGRLIRRIRSEMRDDSSLKISWVAPDRLHLTLHFVGEVEESTAARLVEGIAAPIDLTAFDLTFGAVGTFSSRGRPNVIWLGVADGRLPLIELQRSVGQRLVSAGCELEERPFSPHLTLARLRQVRGTVPQKRAERQKGGLSPVQVQVRSRTLVDRVTLYESRLGRDGATHVPLATGLLKSRGIGS